MVTKPERLGRSLERLLELAKHVQGRGASVTRPIIYCHFDTIPPQTLPPPAS